LFCKNCKYFAPYDFYPLIGLCLKTLSLSFANLKPCNNFELMNPKIEAEKGAIYCLTCKEWIFSWNFEEHKDHELCLNILEDDFVFEEAYSAD